MLELSVLGPLRLRRGDSLLNVSVRKTQALLLSRRGSGALPR
jgi:hypothetical protein